MRRTTLSLFCITLLVFAISASTQLAAIETDRSEIRNNMELYGKNFVDLLMKKSSEDEDENYNIELFNKDITSNLTN